MMSINGISIMRQQVLNCIDEPNGLIAKQIKRNRTKSAVYK